MTMRTRPTFADMHPVGSEVELLEVRYDLPVVPGARGRVIGYEDADRNGESPYVLFAGRDEPMLVRGRTALAQVVPAGALGNVPTTRVGLPPLRVDD